MSTKSMGLWAIDINELKGLIEDLADVVNQACLDPDSKTLDSERLGAYADGMRRLERYGLLEIDREMGRRVIGHWTNRCWRDPILDDMGG